MVVAGMDIGTTIARAGTSGNSTILSITVIPTAMILLKQQARLQHSRLFNELLPVYIEKQ